MNYLEFYKKYLFALSDLCIYLIIFISMDSWLFIFTLGYNPRL